MLILFSTMKFFYSSSNFLDQKIIQIGNRLSNNNLLIGLTELVKHCKWTYLSTYLNTCQCVCLSFQLVQFRFRFKYYIVFTLISRLCLCLILVKNSIQPCQTLLNKIISRIKTERENKNQAFIIFFSTSYIQLAHNTVY